MLFIPNYLIFLGSCHSVTEENSDTAVELRICSCLDISVSFLKLCTQKVRKDTKIFAYMQEKNAVCKGDGAKNRLSDGTIDEKSGVRHF